MAGRLFECCCSYFGNTVVIIACVLIGVKIYVKFTTGVFKSNKKMTGKTVIVTGANTGIGKATALDLAKRGARVILACRDMKRANQAKDEIISKTGNEDVIVRQLDLASLASVREFAKDILDTEPRLDVLINNAGAGGMGSKKTKDGLELGMQINHFGPFLLTNLLLDLLKKSSPSRIIFVSSLAHKFAKFDVENLNFDKWLSDVQVYSYSKLGNILTANELARKLDGSGVTANSLHPGAVDTEIFRKLPVWVLPAFTYVLSHLFKSAEEGAQTTVYLAVSDDVTDVSGKYFAECKEATMSAKAQDEGLAKKVWEKSEYFVKLQPNNSTR